MTKQDIKTVMMVSERDLKFKLDKCLTGDNRENFALICSNASWNLNEYARLHRAFVNHNTGELFALVLFAELKEHYSNIFSSILDAIWTTVSIYSRSNMSDYVLSKKIFNSAECLGTKIIIIDGLSSQALKTEKTKRKIKKLFHHFNEMDISIITVSNDSFFKQRDFRQITINQ